MSDKPAAKAEQGAAPPKSGGGKILGIVGIIVPALLAFGGGFGGAKIAGHGAMAAPKATAEAEAGPPGPTVALDPFMMTLTDESGRAHPMKLNVAAELKHGAKEDEFRVFVPRARDAALTYLRTMTYEQATDSAHLEEVREELKTRMLKTGASQLEHILITDFVIQ